jgi:hypothetical protein
LSPATLCAWRDCIQVARGKTVTQADLTTQLLGFVAKNH